jgi:geranylgeranyl diphosphate synthase type II
MKTLPSWEDTTIKVESILSDYCQKNIKDASRVGDGYIQLWKEIRYLIEAGGKRIRPYLVCLTYGAYGGSDEDNILQIACSWELLHTFMLIHDDIIDRDTVRHNKLNIAGKYQGKYKKLIDKDSEHYSLSAALLAGDLLLSSSYDIVNKSSFSDDIKVAVQAELHAALFSEGGGELLDVESVLYSIQSSDPISIAQYKTAAYSFQSPLVCGARVAGASEDEVRKLDSIGLEVGVSFQLRDDILGVFGEEDKTGKSNRSDIYEKKRTLLVVEALKQLSATKANRLEELYGINRPISSDEVEEVVDLIKESGATTIVETQITDRTKRAREIIDSLAVRDEFKAEIIKLIDKIEVRKS